MNIGKNIKQMRESLGMEQQELAEKLNISNKTISSWECGRTEPKMGMIELMCNVFGCEKTVLIDGQAPSMPMEKRVMEYAKRLGMLSDKQLEDVMQYIEFIEKKGEQHESD